jgi:hypothetical protein
MSHDFAILTFNFLYFIIGRGDFALLASGGSNAEGQLDVGRSAGDDDWGGVNVAGFDGCAWVLGGFREGRGRDCSGKR